jgi:hypothetical protein
VKDLTKWQASIRAGIRDTGIAHDYRAADTGQDAQAATIAARLFDKSRFFRVKFNNCASFAYQARLARITRLAGFPIYLRSKHLVLKQFVEARIV